MRKFSRHVFPPLAAFIALGSLWYAIDALRQGWRFDSYVAVLIGEAVLFSLAACAVWFQWKSHRLLALLCGIALVLYAMSVILLGWEDVGGAEVAVPLATLCVLVGILGFVVSSKERAHV
jgi:hypothetical protein